MLSVAAASRAGHRVTKTVRTMQDSPVKDMEFEGSGLSPAFLGLPNEHVLRVIEGAGDPQIPLDRVEQSGDFNWDDEELEALRLGRKAAELTLSADSVRVYLK